MLLEVEFLYDAYYHQIHWSDQMMAYLGFWLLMLVAEMSWLMPAWVLVVYWSHLRKCPAAEFRKEVCLHAKVYDNFINIITEPSLPLIARASRLPPTSPQSLIVWWAYNYIEVQYIIPIMWLSTFNECIATIIHISGPSQKITETYSYQFHEHVL